MIKTSILALFLALSQCSFSAAYDAPALTLSQRSNEDGIIKALLRTAKPSKQVSGSEFHARQDDSCAPGDLPCDDGVGCCPIGFFCSVSQGQPGCCPVGTTCSGSSGKCPHEDDVRCPDDPNFCCPADDTGPTFTTKISFPTSSAKPPLNTIVLPSSTVNSPILSMPTSVVRLPTSVAVTSPVTGATNAPAQGGNTNSNPFHSGASAAIERGSLTLFLATLTFNFFAA